MGSVMMKQNLYSCGNLLGTVNIGHGQVWEGNSVLDFGSENLFVTELRALRDKDLSPISFDDLLNSIKLH